LYVFELAAPIAVSQRLVTICSRQGSSSSWHTDTYTHRQARHCLSTHQLQALPVPICSSVMHSVVPLFVLDGRVGIVL